MKLTNLLLLAVSALSPLHSFAAGNWADKWFDNAVYDSPSSFDSQKRGYYTMGGFTARTTTSTDYPITISPPRLSVGCGGIDGFLGGFSFLDPDFLVEKAQRAMQAAPYVAFDMALKTMCKECADTLGKIEQITNFLNGIQLNECAMAKPIATAMVERDPSALSGLWTEITGTKNLEEATDRMWSDTTSKIKAADDKPIADLKSMISGCPADFRDLMQHGSIVERAAKKVGMGDYADTIRGYMGDVWIESKTNDKIPVAKSITSCPQNKKFSLDDMLNGRSYVKTIDQQCVPSGSRPVRTVVYQKMESIVSRIKNNQPLTSENQAFINQTNIPVYKILQMAVVTGQDTVTLNVLSELVGLYYTYFIFTDLYRNTENTFDKVNEMVSTPLSDPSAGSKPCRMDLFKPAIAKFDDLITQARDASTKVEAAYNSRLQSYTLNQGFIKSFETQERQYQSDRAAGGLR
ncbi:conjugal transfer protein TraH [Salmonella enterica]|uniref:conjugal transfer protein TraH n=1 Tax=Enterobacter bugandensis TaxID=881260 RepID=UPI001272AA78|nr:conjugal transfer protein TraH [Enterobacter bugandensis]EBY3981275.1 pilus assembly protein [Salmonella enterica subsp. enterica serovar Enteritidis]EEL9185502.1 pilus assembly protein [Salmonella enterica]MCE1555354.1 conjugal transfer protein TraH [Enterobacter hormaechei]ECD0323851.1 pilus assembly protein [Salmonella enterica subsp. enterica serovar Enteritidis]EDE0787500.1 pilus assembly protein [Salmonella enterica subsp. enterica serovar Enteritidis]